MSRLSLFLPPFAGDYSGVCSTLFKCDCLIVILDAGCCTRNYVEYDEPRWKSTRRSTFSAQIRTLETTLGDERSIIQQVVKAVSALSPACIGLVATPVPAIIGMDLDGLALDVERECGIPTIGFSTTGFDTYEKGIALAFEKFSARFADNSTVNPATASNVFTPEDGIKFTVNLLGETPLDFFEQQGEHFVRNLQIQGIRVAFSAMNPFTPDTFAHLPKADANIVVSYGGLQAAKLLQHRFGQPYLPLCPFTSEIAGEIRRLLETIKSAPTAQTVCSPEEGFPILLIGDQVAMITVRSMLRCQNFFGRQCGPIIVASFFSMDSALLEQGDFQITSEPILSAYIEQNPRVHVLGDPLLKRIPGIGSHNLTELTHQAISSTLFTHQSSTMYRQIQIPLSDEQWNLVLKSLCQCNYQ